MEWLKQPLRSRCGPGLAERQVRVLGGRHRRLRDPAHPHLERRGRRSARGWVRAAREAGRRSGRAGAVGVRPGNLADRSGSVVSGGPIRLVAGRVDGVRDRLSARLPAIPGNCSLNLVCGNDLTAERPQRHRHQLDVRVCER